MGKVVQLQRRGLIGEVEDFTKCSKAGLLIFKRNMANFGIS